MRDGQQVGSAVFDGEQNYHPHRQADIETGSGTPPGDLFKLDNMGYVVCSWNAPCNCTPTEDDGVQCVTDWNDLFRNIIFTFFLWERCGSVII